MNTSQLSPKSPCTSRDTSSTKFVITGFFTVANILRQLVLVSSLYGPYILCKQRNAFLPVTLRILNTQMSPGCSNKRSFSLEKLSLNIFLSTDFFIYLPFEYNNFTLICQLTDHKIKLSKRSAHHFLNVKHSL